MNKRINIKILIICLIAIGSINLSGQVITKLNNASFEDDPADATVPMGWFACAQGTTPDILPGFWGVYQESNEGDTYLGLITRENGTYESIGQRFKDPLPRDQCYSFSVELASSDQYAGYGNPIMLRIWVSEDQCQKQQLIYKSQKVQSAEWINIKIEFKPKFDAKYIKFEAFYSDEKFSHQGNILLDNISPIIVCSRV